MIGKGQCVAGEAETMGQEASSWTDLMRRRLWKSNLARQTYDTTLD